MKNILTIILVILLTNITLSQDTTKYNLTPYIGGGLSMTNGINFSSNSYPSIEAGFMFENISIAGVFGRNNLTKTTTENLDNYWIEAKIAYSLPLGFIDGYGILGVGTYFGTSGSLFIEYGFGVCKSFTNNLGGFIQVSNWDGIMYITPGLSLSF